jgi:hypothetical protein
MVSSGLWRFAPISKCGIQVSTYEDESAKLIACGLSRSARQRAKAGLRV